MANQYPPWAPGYFQGFLTWRTFLTKTTAYTVVTGDNGCLFDNSGASGSVTFTLPTLAANYKFGFRCIANQNITVTGASGKMIGFNNAAATSISLQTAGQLIGGLIVVESLPDASAWFAYGMGPNTLTMA